MARAKKSKSKLSDLEGQPDPRAALDSAGLLSACQGVLARLQALFRMPNATTPAFRFGQASTRFLGDLYQDLSEDVRKRYALLQTPDFIESFILDRTLEPAIQRFGLDDAMCTEELGRCSPVEISPHFFLEPSRV